MLLNIPIQKYYISNDSPTTIEWCPNERTLKFKYPVLVVSFE